MGWDGVFVSFHKSYSDFAEFMRKHNSELSDLLIDSQSFIADINPTTIKKTISPEISGRCKIACAYPTVRVPIVPHSTLILHSNTTYSHDLQRTIC